MTKKIFRSAVSAVALAAAMVAGITKNAVHAEGVVPSGRYIIEHVGPREELREQYVQLRDRADRLWRQGHDEQAEAIRAVMRTMEEVKGTDEIKNLVTTVGGNNLLDNHLAGSAYTAAWYLGLVDGGTTPTFNATDTAASHSGWTESTAYSAGTRPAPSWSAASAKSKATTATSFSINATATIAGCFLISNSTKSGTTGVLYSCGAFTGGNKAVSNGDTLNVTYTATA